MGYPVRDPLHLGPAAVLSTPWANFILSVMDNTEKKSELSFTEKELLHLLRTHNLDEFVIGALVDLKSQGPGALLELMHEQLMLLSTDEEEVVTEPKLFYQEFMLLIALAQAQMPLQEEAA